MGDSDQELLRRFAQDSDESAFEALLQRHVDLVHSAALRQAGPDPQSAQDIAQSVFIDLARKAPQLHGHTTLTGWLYTAVRHAATAHRRTEARRTQREQTAVSMNPADSIPGQEPDWNRLRPLLDEAMHALSDDDREAVLLRCFERRAYSEIAMRLGIAENAARMRVERALDRLGGLLTRRGITSTAAGLALVLETHAVTATPTAIAESIARGARGAVCPSDSPSVTSPPGRLRWSWVAAILLMTGIGGLMWTNHWVGRNHPSRLSSDSAARSSESSDPTGSVRSKSEADGAQSGGASSGALTNSSSKRGYRIEGSGLILSFVTQETGDPVPQVKVRYRGYEGSHFTPAEFTASASGEARIQIVPGTTQLELTSISEGFADTRLTWDTTKGDRIPERRQVRLERAMLIGGTVLDPDGNPVADSTVGWNHEELAVLRTSEMSHQFGFIQATTGVNGQWRIQRIAASMLPLIWGLAMHPEFQPSETVGHVGQPGLNRDAFVRELQDLKHVFRLRSASALEGMVSDDGGTPIAGARVRVGPRSMTGSRETRTDSDGRFTLLGGPTGSTVLTAEAEGFAAKTLPVTLTERNDPVRIALAKGVPLRIRVMDTNGAPVPNAHIWLNTFPGPVSGGPQSGSKVQASFEGQSDVEGRAVWENAPSGTHEFDIAATGFLRKNGVLVPADDQEHDILMKPALVLQGTVIDADTGRPIPRFRLAQGWPSINLRSGRTNIQVSGIDRFSPNYSEGRFHQVLEEEVIVGLADQKLMVRIEADGYQPFISRTIGYDEGVVTLDVSLQRTETLEVTVVDAAGRPAPGALVGLVTPGALMYLGSDGLSQPDNGGLNVILRADEEGRVKLQKDPTVERLVVAGSRGILGFSETSWTRLQSDAVLPLVPWGRIRGRVLGTPGALGGKVIALSVNEEGVTGFTLDFTTQTDVEGKFEFPKAPAGSIRVEERIVEKSGLSSMSYESRSVLVTVKPNETQEVTLGGKTRVTGRLTPPAGFQPQPDGLWHVALMGTDQAKPLSQVRSADSPFAGPEPRARVLPAIVEAAGAFAIDAVEPGIYELHAKWIRRPAPGQFAGYTPGLLEQERPLRVTVTPDSGPIDLGEIQLKAPSNPAPSSGPKS